MICLEKWEAIQTIVSVLPSSRPADIGSVKTPFQFCGVSRSLSITSWSSGSHPYQPPQQDVSLLWIIRAGCGSVCPSVRPLSGPFCPELLFGGNYQRGQASYIMARPCLLERAPKSRAWLRAVSSGAIPLSGRQRFARSAPNLQGLAEAQRRARPRHRDPEPLLGTGCTPRAGPEQGWGTRGDTRGHEGAWGHLGRLRGMWGLQQSHAQALFLVLSQPGAHQTGLNLQNRGGRKNSTAPSTAPK